MVMHKRIAGAVAGLALVAATAAEAQEPRQGGRMVVTYKDDVSTLDPAIGYDWQNWSMIKSLFDGLMDYRPGTTELVPDLAERYELAADGQTYTFTLRPGVRFHNGRELASADLKYSIERVLDPKTQSPGAGFFGSIASIETPDPRTIVFKLNRPDATFLHVMAINFAFAVPKEEADRHGSDFGKNPVGTGAFRMKEWTLGQRLVFERNRDYFKTGLPRLDEITFEFGQEPLVALLRFERGEVDILGDPVPPAKFLEVRNNPDLKDNLIVGGQLHTGYVTMNVNVPPFDKKEVRQAVNHAINKERIVRIINNRGVPASQPLPPSMPGYAPDYQGYAFDPAKAKELLAAAGQGGGFDTVLYAFNTDPNPRIAQAIQQDLASIGIRAELRTLAQANVIQAGGERTTAPMIWSGGMAWIADFPDPSNFYAPILSCSAAADGGWGWSKYCSPTLDEKAARADAITDPARQEERLKLWREIFLAVMDDAPWAPVFNEQRFTLKSDRLGGDDALFVDPVHIPVHYDEVYAKDAQ